MTEVFGAGTAVVVSPFSGVGFEGEDFPLPEINAKSISSLLKEQLDGIRKGKVADAHGWVYKVY